MKENEKRPIGIVSERSDISLGQQRKDKNNLSNRQRNVLNLLKRGKYSAADITIALGLCDPRSYVRELRRRGIIVCDEWVENEDTRYKRYWI